MTPEQILLKKFTEVEDLADFGKMDSLMEEARNLLAQSEVNPSIFSKLAKWYDSYSVINKQRVIRDLFDPSQEELRELMLTFDIAFADRDDPTISEEWRIDVIDTRLEKLDYDSYKFWNYLKELK